LVTSLSSIQAIHQVNAKSWTVNDLIAIINSDEFKAKAMNKFKEVWFLNTEKQFKDWNTSNNVDVNQLHLLLQFINVHDSIDYQLGFITQQNEKLPNGKSTYAITIFPNRTSGLVYGLVV
jgi:hypothetical protein